MKLRRWEVESRHRHHRQRPGGVESADGPSFRDEGPSALPFPIPSCSGQIRISGFCGGEHDDHRLSKIRCRWHSTGGPDAVGVFWEGHSIAVAAAGPRVNKWTKTNEGLFSSFPERSDARPATKQFRGFFLFSLWFFFLPPFLIVGGMPQSFKTLRTSWLCGIGGCCVLICKGGAEVKRQIEDEENNSPEFKRGKREGKGIEK